MHMITDQDRVDIYCYVTGGEIPSMYLPLATDLAQLPGSSTNVVADTYTLLAQEDRVLIASTGCIDGRM